MSIGTGPKDYEKIQYLKSIFVYTVSPSIGFFSEILRNIPQTQPIITRKSGGMIQAPTSHFLQILDPPL